MKGRDIGLVFVLIYLICSIYLYNKVEECSPLENVEHNNSLFKVSQPKENSKSDNLETKTYNEDFTKLATFRDIIGTISIPEIETSNDCYAYKDITLNTYTIPQQTFIKKLHKYVEGIEKHFYTVSEEIPQDKFYYALPDCIDKHEQWRYESKDLFWNRKDKLTEKFQYYNSSLEFPPLSVKQKISSICKQLEGKYKGEKLCSLFTNCFPNTLETTARTLEDSTTYVITGDIPLMWLRDSAAQVNQYLSLAKGDIYIQILIEGMIRRSIKWIQIDPYGSSFRLKLDFDDVGKEQLTEWDIQSGRTIHAAMHNYEIDSLCYFIKISYDYWKATGIKEIFDIEWFKSLLFILNVWEIEQNHSEFSSYRYPELSPSSGSPTCYTGMSWCGFRPSDDRCTFHYHIPSNAFIVASIDKIEEILIQCYKNDIKDHSFFNSILNRFKKLQYEVDEGIHKFGVIFSSGLNKKVYAYEVDGCGRSNLMDDANVPSLLSLDYLGYKSKFDPNGEIAKNTRDFILSPSNPFYFAGTNFKGIGSPHTPGSNIWHIALTMQALTSNDKTEIRDVVDMIVNSDAGTNFMHESFNVNNPSRYTRTWFAWANSLFSELVIRLVEENLL